MDRVARRLMANRASAAALPCRALCTEKTPRPPRPRGDSDFVKRRRSYRDAMHQLRLRFADESRARQESARAQRSVRHSGADDGEHERNARKRERSMQRLQEHRERLRRVQQLKQERAAFKRGVWERKQQQLADRRESVVQLLVNEAPKWITEDTLDKHVEQAVDEFFIEGVADARRDEEALRVSGEVGGPVAA